MAQQPEVDTHEHDNRRDTDQTSDLAQALVI